MTDLVFRHGDPEAHRRRGDALTARRPNRRITRSGRRAALAMMAAPGFKDDAWRLGLADPDPDGRTGAMASGNM
jgi:hypothetical protein